MNSTLRAIQTNTTPGSARRAGRDGSQNFSMQDKMALLEAIDKFRPIGPANWDQVVDV
jgi:hypothetical protein